jgi:ABC-2 type transport system ATP-binding protein
MIGDKKGIQENILEMDSATLDFGNGTGVYDLTFYLPPKTIMGFIGPSGSGKTTTMRLLTGIYRPTAGMVRVFGKEPSRFQHAEKARIGYIPQHFLLYKNLNVEENLKFMAGMYGLTPHQHREYMDELLVFFELDKARKRLGRHLSGGMQRRLMLAGALIHRPDLIFADEPTAGIDPVLRERIWAHFRKLRDEGRSLMVTTQYVGEAAYCDIVAVMRNGRVILVDTPKALRRRAMGGEIVHLQVDPNMIYQTMEHLARMPRVKKVEPADGENSGIFVFVKNAGREIPAIISALMEDLKITPKKVEPYLPPFDEVFVRLLKQVEAE